MYFSGKVPKITLTEHRKDFYVQVGRELGREILQCTGNYENASFQYVKSGVSIFKDKSNHHLEALRGVGNMDALIDEVVEVTVPLTNEELKLHMTKMNQDFLDGHMIEHILPPSKEKPYESLSIKWIAETYSTPLVKNRDYCYLEYTNKGLDSLGRASWFQIMVSIDIPECPELESSFHLIRGKFLPLTGCVYAATKNADTLEVSSFCSLDLVGNMPSWFVTRCMERRILQIRNLEKCIQRKRLEKIVFFFRRPILHSYSSCEICSKPFSTVRRKYHCHVCGETICSKCSVKQQQILCFVRSSGRMCVLCVCNQKIRYCYRHHTDLEKKIFLENSKGNSINHTRKKNHIYHTKSDSVAKTILRKVRERNKMLKAKKRLRISNDLSVRDPSTCSCCALVGNRNGDVFKAEDCKTYDATSFLKERALDIKENLHDASCSDGVSSYQDLETEGAVTPEFLNEISIHSEDLQSLSSTEDHYKASWKNEQKQYLKQSNPCRDDSSFSQHRWANPRNELMISPIFKKKEPSLALKKLHRMKDRVKTMYWKL